MNSWKGPLFVLLSALCLSLNGTLQALAPEGATSLSICFARMTIGSAFLFTWCALSGRLPKRNSSPLPWKLLCLCAFLMFCSQSLFFIGLRYTGVAAGTVVNLAAIPIFSALIAAIFFHTRQSGAWYAATAVAVAGTALLCGQGADLSGTLAAMSLPIGAGLCYAIFLIFNKRLPQDIAPEGLMALIMGIVALIYSPVLFFFPMDWLFCIRGLLVALGLGVVSAGLGFSFITAGLRHTEPTTASTLGLAEPMVASCLGIFVLGEDSGPLTITGILLVFASIVILIIAEARQNPVRRNPAP